MLEKTRTRPDLLLLLSLLFVILMHPILDHGDVRRLVLAGLMFLPLMLATVRLVEIKRAVWPGILLMAASLAFGATSAFLPTRTIIGTKWTLIAVFLAISVAGLFSYIRHASSVSDVHLTTAISIYLLLAMQWYAIYSALETFWPGSIQHSGVTVADRQSELLYFSLITLSTIGYGDVVPIGGVARMLAALEGVTGVLYVAITVALLVSAYKQPNNKA